MVQPWWLDYRVRMVTGWRWCRNTIQQRYDIITRYENGARIEKCIDYLMIVVNMRILVSMCVCLFGLRGEGAAARVTSSTSDGSFTFLEQPFNYSSASIGGKQLASEWEVTWASICQSILAISGWGSIKVEVWQAFMTNYFVKWLHSDITMASWVRTDNSTGLTFQFGCVLSALQSLQCPSPLCSYNREETSGRRQFL